MSESDGEGRRTSTTGTAKPARVTKRRAETRARLIDTALRVFAEKGFGHVTIEDVCAAAGYTRGAFYSQFASLEELFFILYDRWAARIAEQVRDVAENVLDGASPLDDLPDVVERIVDTLVLDRDWLLIKMDFLMYAARHPDVAERWSVHRAQLREAIEERLSASRIALHKSIGTATETALAVIAVYDGVSVQLLLDDDQDAARTWLTQLLNVVLTD